MSKLEGVSDSVRVNRRGVADGDGISWPRA